MPTYSYRCTECTNAFDIHQAFTDDSLTVCPVCGGKLRKVFSAVGVTFNGSGFYRTDSRAGDKSGGSSSSSSTGKTSGSGDSSSSSTPAAPSTSSSSGSTSGSGSSSGSSTPAASSSSAK
ncbi:FmdB family zinc ribbon protein [Agreia sp. VKM Ac-1783]|uniref:FmdB family zinc ribbon protein n=1 Tax=Agreia sp. VKM Ac-1783 TaxID=1938889 RepID=UPI000A2AEA07|nr:FmdB family zinc ribbon protein [Agreia sp. VKM Ac-1783]SMQ71962.1 putative regulatory protein, FmdB family [Agreia sp. VKM Ac-1783]